MTLMLNPIINLEVPTHPEQAAENARDAKVLPLVQRKVEEIFVPREYVAGLALLKEVDASDIIVLEEDVLVLACH